MLAHNYLPAVAAVKCYFRDTPHVQTETLTRNDQGKVVTMSLLFSSLVVLAVTGAEWLLRMAVALRGLRGMVAGLTVFELVYRELMSKHSLVVMESATRSVEVKRKKRVGLKVVFIVRHGESEWNVAQRSKNVVKMFGRFDHGLTEEGANQAERLRQRLRLARRTELGTEFASARTVYCSPLTRAIHTALIALAGHSALKKGIELSADLRELCYPVAGFDSMRRVPAQTSMRRARRAIGPRLSLPIERGLGLLSDTEDSFLLGETRRAASKRIARVVFDMLCRDEHTAVVVGHSLFFKALIANFADAAVLAISPDAKRLASHKLPNAGVARLVLNCSKPRFPIVAVDQCFDEHHTSLRHPA